jgi:hypothetical protein
MQEHLPLIIFLIIISGYGIGKGLQLWFLWQNRQHHKRQMAQVADIRRRIEELERKRFITPEQRAAEAAKTAAQRQHDIDRTIDVQARFID